MPLPLALQDSREPFFNVALLGHDLRAASMCFRSACIREDIAI